MPSWFTRVQLKMLVVLADGKSHTREELHSCLVDDLGPLKNIRAHLTGIRKHLRPLGHDIVCEIRNRRVFYRQVRAGDHAP